MEPEYKYAEETYNPGDKLSFSLQSGDRKDISDPDENSNLNLDEFTDDRHAENVMTRNKVLVISKIYSSTVIRGKAGDAWPITNLSTSISRAHHRLIASTPEKICS